MLSRVNYIKKPIFNKQSYQSIKNIKPIIKEEPKKKPKFYQKK